MRWSSYSHATVSAYFQVVTVHFRLFRMIWDDRNTSRDPLSSATVVSSFPGYNFFRSTVVPLCLISNLSVILLVYLVVSLAGYTVYGNSLVNTLIPSIQVSFFFFPITFFKVQWISTTVNVLITAHVLPAILIFFCPLAHQVEEWTNCSHGILHWKKTIIISLAELGFQRFFARSFVLLLCVFTALSLPNFGVVMDLVRIQISFENYAGGRIYNFSHNNGSSEYFLAFSFFRCLAE